MAAAAAHPDAAHGQIDKPAQQPQPVGAVPSARSADPLNRPEGTLGRGSGDYRLLPLDQP